MITNTKEKICFQSVYYIISSSDDQLLDPIVIRPTISQNRFSWEDTARGRIFIFKEIDLTPEEIENYQKGEILPKRIKVITHKGQEIQLGLLTHEIFNNQIKNLVAGTLSFKSDKELEDYYLNKNFSSF